MVIYWNSNVNILIFSFSRHSNLPSQSKMAARADAAASLSPYRTVFSCFLSCKSQCFCTSSSRLPVFKRAYSREFLLDVGRITFLEINSGPRCCGTSVCSGGLHHHRPPLLHLAHSGGATSGVRGSRRGVSAEVSDNDTAALAKKAQQLPPQTQKSQSPGPHHVHLLQRHHREHSD